MLPLLAAILCSVASAQTAGIDESLAVAINLKIEEVKDKITADDFASKSTGRISVWAMESDILLFKIDPPEACPVVFVCTVEKAATECSNEANSKKLVVLLNKDKPLTKTEKGETFITDSFFTAQRDQGKIKIWSGRDKKASELDEGTFLRFEASSFYCRVSAAMKDGSQPIHHLLIDQTTLLQQQYEKPDMSKLGPSDLGPMYLLEGGLPVANQPAIDIKPSTVHDCPRVDEWTDFAEWQPIGDYDLKKKKQQPPFYRYSITPTEGNGTKSLMVELEDKQYSATLGLGKDICRGFSLCFHAEGDRKTLCTDKRATLEIYPQYMMMIGPDSPKARQMRIPRHRSQYFRLLFDQTKGRMDVTYDRLGSGSFYGSREVFYMEDASFTTVDVMMDGAGCQVRLLSDEGSSIAASKCSAYTK